MSECLLWHSNLDSLDRGFIFLSRIVLRRLVYCLEVLSSRVVLFWIVMYYLEFCISFDFVY